MIRYLILFLLSLLVFQNAAAQNFPFEARLMVRLPGTNTTDTVWFGCDTAATNNYDPGFDSLQTTFKDSIGILAHDTSAETQFGTGSCGNLRRIIKPFDDFVYFDFFIKVDSVLGGGSSYPYPFPQLFWDTTDFMYNGAIFHNDSFRLVVVNVKSYGGNIESFDQNEIHIYSVGHRGDCIPSDSSFLYVNEVDLVIFSLPYCYSNDYFIHLRLGILFKWICTPLGINSYQENEIKVSPNPTSDYLFINSEFRIVEIYSIEGVKQSFTYTNDKVDVSSLPPGMYFLKIDNQLTKFIKQ